MIAHSCTGLASIVCLVLLYCLPWSQASGLRDEPSPDPEDLVPGLVSEFWPLDDDEPRVTRHSLTLVNRWGRAVPDLRLPSGGFRGRWSGWLLVRDQGDYRFRIHSDGPHQLRVGSEIIRGEGGDASVSEKLSLNRGLIRLDLTTEHQGDDRRITVDWDGPTFSFEHLPTSVLFHEEAPSLGSDSFERGRQLSERLGCANCHSAPGFVPRPLAGPPLDDELTIHRDWLLNWIVDPEGRRQGTPMPGFGLDTNQASDIVSYLESVSRKPADLDRESRMAINIADPLRGRLLFRSLGCLGCHNSGASGNEHPLTGASVSLAGLGGKRSIESVASFLRGVSRPDSGRHRPELDLSADSAAHLAAYLTGMRSEQAQPGLEHPISGNPDRGHELITSVGCASCHRIPGVEADRAPIPLDFEFSIDRGCLADSPRFGVPNFGLDANERFALRTYLSEANTGHEELAGWMRAEDSIRRHNCLGCHTRYGQGGHGISSQLPTLLGEDQELNALKGTLTPPDLSSVGAKLKEDYLARAIAGDAPRARPWLRVQMPRFNFEPGEAKVIADYFLQMDRVDRVSEPETPSPHHDSEVEPGVTLLGRDGFGCVSCHVIQGKIPPGGEAETLGPDLALAHQRMNRSYFDRWLSDPQRILPGTAMPQFLLPSPGIDGSVAEQLGMIWDVLGHPDLSTLTSTATRQLLTRHENRALVVRDVVVLDADPRTYVPRGIAVGLTGVRSLLFDSDRLSWIRWWDQGFLYRTKQGRLWEWHPEGRVLWQDQKALPPVVFSDKGGAIRLPGEQRSRFGSFVELRFVEDGVRLEYSLSLPDGGSSLVVEHIAPTEDGWSRRVEIQDLPEQFIPLMVVATGANWDDQGVSRLALEGVTVELQTGSTGLPRENSLERAFQDVLFLELQPRSSGTFAGEVVHSIRSE